ncbi:MAG: CAP domain-containing protein [Pseudonocardiaceae bacterium]|nr:MAG: CAP domain-containing protein [Pseudonocardiaceae bacterium]
MRSTNLRRNIVRLVTAGVLSLASLGGIAAVAAPAASAAPADCAYNPGGRGGYGSYVDGLALDQMDWEQDLANAINSYRASKGLRPLTYSRTLARPSMWASLDSYARGFSPSDHVDTRGMGIAQRVQFCSGYTGFVGEINYWARGSQAYTGWQAALNWWKNSPGHNAWLLNARATTFAVGLAYEGETRTRTHYTVVFGDH